MLIAGDIFFINRSFVFSHGLGHQLTSTPLGHVSIRELLLSAISWPFNIYDLKYYLANW
jgi:hypothetical protein